MSRSFSRVALRRLLRGTAWALAGLLVLGGAGWWAFGHLLEAQERGESTRTRERVGTVHAPAVAPEGHTLPRATEVVLDADQQRAIGLKTQKVVSGTAYDVLAAPGRIAPNESHYAYITPRAAGIVRDVQAHIGQEVRAGDLLALIDSPDVGTARLDLYARLQMLDVAKTQADWQEVIYRNTLELIEHLQKGEKPEEIHRLFADRPVGENRERLMTAYAKYRLGRATIERNRELYAQKLITPKQFEEVTAGYEVAMSTYQALMDQMGFEARLAHTRAQQAKRQAEAAVRLARERLRILGVNPDGTEPEVAGGKVVGVRSDGTLPVSEKAPATEEPPEAILPEKKEQVGVRPVGAPADTQADGKDKPVSTYSIWAPFDGTILDRELVVPGVAVDTTSRIFTLADLSTVWIEANVHESDFPLLVRSQGKKARFRSPAYPGRVFEGEVLYKGDLVDEKSRMVKLLARATNPDRMLKPGMFVEVEILSPRPEPAPQIPSSALLTEGDLTFVYVREGPDRFERREVVTESGDGGLVAVRQGLEPGEEVVVEGGFKLKSLAIQLASAGE